jgi:hypothetical protein
MTIRALSASIVIGLLAMSGARAAHADSEVVLQVPLNLTKLATDISKVKVTCIVTPDSPERAIGRAEQTFAVLNGQVVTTASVIVPIVDTAAWHQADKVGTPVAYGCLLTGFSEALQRWDEFAENAATEAFRLSPTPAPIQGMFTW